MERLDKFLCSQSNLTRSEAGRAIRCGRVTVDGTVCRQAAQKIDPDTQQVAVHTVGGVLLARILV